MLGIVQQSESAFCVVWTTLVQLDMQRSKIKLGIVGNFIVIKILKNININIICNIIIFIKGDISPDHQVW